MDDYNSGGSTDAGIEIWRGCEEMRQDVCLQRRESNRH